MDHGDWIRKEFKKLSASLGFRFTPRGEIEDRLVRVKKAMERTDIEGLLVLQKMNYYYLSGTTQDGALFLPLEGKPLLAVKREFERAKLESPLEDVVPFKSSQELPALIQNHFGKAPGTLGLEFDVLPVRDYFRYQALFKSTTLERRFFHSKGHTKDQILLRNRSYQGSGKNRTESLPTGQKDSQGRDD